MVFGRRHAATAVVGDLAAGAAVPALATWPLSILGKEPASAQAARPGEGSGVHAFLQPTSCPRNAYSIRMSAVRRSNLRALNLVCLWQWVFPTWRGRKIRQIAWQVGPTMTANPCPLPRSWIIAWCSPSCSTDLQARLSEPQSARERCPTGMGRGWSLCHQVRADVGTTCRGSP